VSDPRPRVAVVTPVYNEEAALPLYEAAVRESLEWLAGQGLATPASAGAR